MIKATSDSNAPVTFNVSIEGLAIYLDNFSLIRLAKQDPSRRVRFINALHSGADLMFSLTNAAEISAFQDGTLKAVRSFLDEIGPHWFPVELNPVEVVERESNGVTQAQSCISQGLMKNYFRTKTSNDLPGSARIIDLSESFFRLGNILDWVGPQRDSIAQGSRAMDEALIEKIRDHRTEFDKLPQWLDQTFPALPFIRSRPATFVYVNLVRRLILDAKGYPLKKGDGTDFCHTVIASAFANVATLDKHWKRRVEDLPQPNEVARIYYAPQLDEMVEDIENCLKSR